WWRRARAASRTACRRRRDATGAGRVPGAGAGRCGGRRSWLGLQCGEKLPERLRFRGVHLPDGYRLLQQRHLSRLLWVALATEDNGGLSCTRRDAHQVAVGAEVTNWHHASPPRCGPAIRRTSPNIATACDSRTAPGGSGFAARHASRSCSVTNTP